MKFHLDGTRPRHTVFVFGSNLAGVHGAGAAQVAYRYYGATWGVGIGFSGHSYAIPTKDVSVRGVLSLDEIKLHVMQFLVFARRNPQYDFFVTAIGTGLAGYRHEQIAPMFRGAPDNCSFPDVWKEWLT